MSELNTPKPKITGADLARAYIEKIHDPKKPADELSRTDIALDAAQQAAGLKHKGTLQTAGAVLDAGYGLATNAPKYVGERLVEAVAGGLTGAATQDKQDATHVAGLAGTAFSIAATGGAAIIPAVAMQAWETKKYLEERGERKALEAGKAATNRIEAKRWEYTFEGQLQEREMRRGWPEDKQKAYNEQTLQAAIDGHKLGFTDSHIRDRIQLETLVKDAGGETEPWFNQFEQFKANFNAEMNLQGNDNEDENFSLGRSNHLFKELGGKEKDHSTDLSLG